MALPLVFVVGIILPVFAAGLRCDVCRQQIRGQYYSIGSKEVCTSCYSRYSKCPGCGIPIRSSSYRHQGQRVCLDCARRAGRCRRCGDVLLGRYYTDQSGNLRYCASCYDNKPHCRHCDLPKRRMRKVDSLWICQDCEKEAKHCAGCEQPIVGSYYTIPHVPGEFCRTCMEERPRCGFCSRPIVKAGTGRRLADGRITCVACASTAVTDVDEAVDLLAETVDFLERVYGMQADVAFDFVLVDNNDIAFVMDHENDGTLAELGIFSQRLTSFSPRPVILIISDLPKSAFLETAAHEYAHLWQMTRNPDLEDMEMIEGFAQWTAAKWLKHKRYYSEHAAIETRSDPLYGKGYQKLKSFEHRYGYRGVLRLVVSQNRKDRPVGKSASTSALLKPLSELLPAMTFQGKYDFLRDAVVLDNVMLRRRFAELEKAAAEAKTKAAEAENTTAATRALQASPPGEERHELVAP